MPPVEVSAFVVIVWSGLTVSSFGNVKRVMPPDPIEMFGAFTFVAESVPAVIPPVTLSAPKTLIRPATVRLPVI